jgi:hypothetical protein
VSFRWRMSRINFLARLRAAKRPTCEFAFPLEPIVEITAWLFAAFEIDFVCAMDCLVASFDLYRITDASSKFSRGLRGCSLLGSP